MLASLGYCSKKQFEAEDMNQHTPVSVTANGRDYSWPRVCGAICLDGCEPAYLDEAIAAGLMPTLEKTRRDGPHRLSVIPSSPT